MKKNEGFYIASILFALNRIESYLKGVTEKQFSETDILQDGVYRQLEIVGEASSKLSQKTQKIIGDFPWRDIVALRNKLIHEYFGIDVQTVWTIAKEDLPKFKKAIENSLDSDPQLSKFLKMK